MLREKLQMKTQRSGARRWLVAAWLFFVPAVSFAADPVAGRGASAACGQCHEPGDWQGETQASLESLIRDVVASRVKHPQKITLGDQDIANIAAYWASASR